MGEAVGVPQPVQQALFLQVGLEFFLLQGPAFPLQAQLGVVGLAGGPVILRPGLVQGPLGLEAGLPLGSQGLAGLFQGGNLLLQGGDLLGEALVLCRPALKLGGLAGPVGLGVVPLTLELIQQGGEGP